MGLKVSKQQCSTSDPCSGLSNVSGCISDSKLKSVGVGNVKLQKEAAEGFIKMYADMPKDIKSSVNLTDGYRPLKVQCNIFDWSYYESTGKRRKKGTAGTAVAMPGTSNHGWGRAIDIFPDKVQRWIKENGPKYGWCWGEVKSEPWHFTFCGPGENRDKNCDRFCTGKMTVDISSSKDTTTDTSTSSETPSTTEKSSEESKDKNLSMADLLGGAGLKQWLDTFMPIQNKEKKSDKESEKKDEDKTKINEEIQRISEIIRKVL